MNPKISVIVPVYNVESYIKKCVDSIICQSYSNLEIILIDDGSPDNCPDICDRYLEKDPRVKVVHKQNGGLSDARNAGIGIATGDYISFVDSDDWIDKDYFEILYNLLIESESEISICNFKWVYPDRIESQKCDCEFAVWTNEEALKHYYDDMNVNMVISVAKLYKSELFTGVRFPVGKIHEDEFTTHKLLFKAKRIVFTARPLYNYFQRSSSITGQGFNIDFTIHAIEAFRERTDFIKETGLHALYLQSVRYEYASLRRKYELASNLNNQAFITEIVKKRASQLYKAEKYAGINVRRILGYKMFILSPKAYVVFAGIKKRLGIE